MPVRSLNSSVLKWPDAQVVDRAVRLWVKETVSNRTDVLRIGYFGSYARGDWGVGSDLDLVIVVAHSEEPFERRGCRWDVTGLPVPSDLLVYTEEEWKRLSRCQGFHCGVEQEAVWVYNKEKAMGQHMTSTESLLTGEDLLRMGDVGSCELTEGRVVPMSPTGGEHGHIEYRLGFELGLFVQREQAGWVLVGEVGIYTRRDPDTVRDADVAFISRKRAPDGPPKGFLEVVPELVVEIISPTDRQETVRRKIEECFTAGVVQVWVVEPEDRSVRIYSSPTQARKFAEGDWLSGEGTLEGFSLKVSNLFEI